MNLPKDNTLPQRQNPAVGVHFQLGQSNIVLLTINTDKRGSWLANEAAHQLLRQTWSEATAWLVGDYLLMPDHLHLFCAPRDFQFTIETWIAYWKREFAWKRKRLAGTLAPPSTAPAMRLAPPRALLEWKFQSRGWHHRLRDGENYSEKWLYVQENPVRAGLSIKPEDWPYQGRVHEIHW